MQGHGWQTIAVPRLTPKLASGPIRVKRRGIGGEPLTGPSLTPAHPRVMVGSHRRPPGGAGVGGRPTAAPRSRH